MFRQDLLDNQDIIFAFLPPCGTGCRKAKSIIPLRGKAFDHCLQNNNAKKGEKP